MVIYCKKCIYMIVYKTEDRGYFLGTVGLLLLGGVGAFRFVVIVDLSVVDGVSETETGMATNDDMNSLLFFHQS